MRMGNRLIEIGGEHTWAWDLIVRDAREEHAEDASPPFLAVVAAVPAVLSKIERCPSCVLDLRHPFGFVLAQLFWLASTLLPVLPLGLLEINVFHGGCEAKLASSASPF
jgi:hypothetical protein